MRTTILNELKQNFNSYAPFWDEWKEYQFNGLDATDIYTLEIQINNDFIIDLSDFMFYNQPERLESLSAKLRANYSEFQDWLIIRFQFAIVRLAKKIPLSLFFRIPLDHFYRIPAGINTLSPELVTTLQKFNCNSLLEIFLWHTDKSFRDARKFALVLEFQTTLKIEHTIYQTLRKEVRLSKQNCTLN